MSRPVASSEIRVGVIGFGFATQTFHLPLLQSVGYRVVAFASSRPHAVRQALPTADVVADPAALARRDDVDLIVIATPNSTHAPLADTVLRAGRHVVVDKPFTLTAAEARALAGLAAERGLLLSIFQNRRWDSDFLTLRDAMQRGVLGRVASLESRFDRFRPQVRDRWRERPAPGAGLLYDLGPHLIDQALLLFGVPESVQANLAAQRDGAMAADAMHLVLRYGRLIVTLEAGSLIAGGTARFAVHGDRASLVKHGADRQEDQLRAGMTPGAPGWGEDPDDAVLYDGATGRTSTVKALAGDQREYYRALREALRGGGPNPVPPAQGTAVMAVIEAALLADAEGRRVVPDLRPDERSAWSPVTRP